MVAELTIPTGHAFTAEEFERCRKDPVYFVDTYCTTFNPRVPPYNFPFRLYPFQKEALLWVVAHIDAGKDGVIEKSRDMGATWLVLCAVAWYWLFKPGFQAKIGSRKQDDVDTIGDMSTLFPKLEYLIRNLPFEPDGFSLEKNRTFMRLVNPMNGNVIVGESSNPNFSRSGRYRVVLFDEGAFWSDIGSAWPSAGDSTPCRLMITTPPEKVNFAKYLRFSGKTDVLTLHWRQHPLKDEAWYEGEKSRRTPEELAREVDINWEGSVTGRVYPEVARVREGPFPYRPDWPLYVSHDPGRKPDPWAVGWFQVNPETGRYRLVDSYEKHGQDAEWWLPFFGRPIDSTYAYTPDELALIEVTKEWKQASHVGDQAGRMTNPTNGESVYSRLSDNGIHVSSNTKANDLETRKRYARQVLSSLDVNGTPRNRYFMECVRSARYPDLGENSNRVTPNSVPVHDWTSHTRTMLEYFAVNIDMRREADREEPGEGTFLAALAAVQSMHIREET